MPYKFRIITRFNLRTAPSTKIPAGKINFLLLDSEDNPIPNEKIEFHVMYGGGSFIEYVQTTLSSGVTIQEPVRRQVIRGQTNSSGIIESPLFEMDPEEGPNAIMIQSANASLETIFFGTYENTRLEILEPLPNELDKVTDTRFDVKIKAVDTSDPSNPQAVPNLPLEAEIFLGSATMEVDGSHNGHYLLKRTVLSENIESGTLKFKVLLGRRPNLYELW